MLLLLALTGLSASGSTISATVLQPNRTVTFTRSPTTFTHIVTHSFGSTFTTTFSVKSPNFCNIHNYPLAYVCTIRNHHYCGSDSCSMLSMVLWVSRISILPIMLSWIPRIFEYLLSISDNDNCYKLFLPNSYTRYLSHFDECNWCDTVVSGKWSDGTRYLVGRGALAGRAVRSGSKCSRPSTKWQLFDRRGHKGDVDQFRTSSNYGGRFRICFGYAW